jgi:hypothetical protein
MARTPHIQPEAESTTVYLTKAQKAAIRKLQAKRLEETGSEPGLTEVVLEGLKLLLDHEGWAVAELGSVFPKTEVQHAKVSVISKRRRSARSRT